MLLGALDNKPGVARDIVTLNAGAALYAADVVDIDRGRHRARRAKRSRAARAREKARRTRALHAAIQAIAAIGIRDS